MECTVENKRLVSLSKVVNASIIDTYEDTGKMYQRNTHWACRGLKELYQHALPKLKHKVWLHVNKNTHTATLPNDFDTETFVGGLDANWNKIPLKLNNKLVDRKNIIDIPCDDDKCDKCKQDKNICNDLSITEETNPIVINGTAYDQTIVKKLYPNGDYYLETTTPVLNVDDDTIEYPVTKEFITNLDLKPCGCIETSTSNLTALQQFCPSVYCNYFSPCDCRCNRQFGYKIFDESGLIQFDNNFPFDKCYIEYYGFIQKIKGQYYVPYVAFETLVEWTKFRSIKDKRNIPRWERKDQEEYYKVAKGNMMKILGRVSLYRIIESIAALPKFDVDYGCNDWYACFAQNISLPAVLPSSSIPECDNAGGNSGTIINNTTILNRGNYTLAVKVDGNPGSPVAGESTYQNNVLKNAFNIEYIFAAKGFETVKDNDFEHIPATGVIDRFGKIWVMGDTLIIPYSKDSSAPASLMPVNEPVLFYDAATYDLAWTPELRSVNGNGGNFYVEIFDENGVARHSIVDITPDDLYNTTMYHFDFGGVATGRITF